MGINLWNLSSEMGHLLKAVLLLVFIATLAFGELEERSIGGINPKIKAHFDALGQKLRTEWKEFEKNAQLDLNKAHDWFQTRLSKCHVDLDKHCLKYSVADLDEYCKQPKTGVPAICCHSCKGHFGTYDTHRRP